jgi:hypothetical protein
MQQHRNKNSFLSKLIFLRYSRHSRTPTQRFIPAVPGADGRAVTGRVAEIVNEQALPMMTYQSLR